MNLCFTARAGGPSLTVPLHLCPSVCLSSSHLLSLSASLRKGVIGVFSYLIYHKCNNLAITLPESLLFSSAIYSCYLHSASSLVFLFFHSPSLDTNTICHSVTEPVKQRKPLRLSTFRLEQELKDVEGCNDTTQPSTADQGCAVARAESYATRVKNVMRRRWRRGPGKD